MISIFQDLNIFNVLMLNFFQDNKFERLSEEEISARFDGMFERLRTSKARLEEKQQKKKAQSERKQKLIEAKQKKKQEIVLMKTMKKEQKKQGTNNFRPLFEFLNVQKRLC